MVLHLKCNYVTNLNEYIHSNKISELIRISEALHEKKIAQIADHIVESIEDLRLILYSNTTLVKVKLYYCQYESLKRYKFKYNSC